MILGGKLPGKVGWASFFKFYSPLHTYFFLLNEASEYSEFEYPDKRIQHSEELRTFGSWVSKHRNVRLKGDLPIVWPGMNLFCEEFNTWQIQAESTFRRTAYIRKLSDQTSECPTERRSFYCLGRKVHTKNNCIF